MRENENKNQTDSLEENMDNQKAEREVEEKKEETLSEYWPDDPG